MSFMSAIERTHVLSTQNLAIPASLTAGVDNIWYYGKMVRVYTGRNETKMIDGKSFWNKAISEPVAKAVDTLIRSPNFAIAILINGANPKPTLLTIRSPF